jgi:phytoene synthase
VEYAQGLDPALAVALAWQPQTTRPALGALFNLDRRLAAAIAQANEPMLAQIRLAWWRDRLAEPAFARPIGEPLLAAITEHWGDRCADLSPLVDGWERWLFEDTEGLGEGRGQALASFASLASSPESSEAAAAAGRNWTRAQTRQGGTSVLHGGLRSRTVRGIAVLDGLARRAIERNEPLMHGRGGALAAIRLGMFGA